MNNVVTVASRIAGASLRSAARQSPKLWRKTCMSIPLASQSSIIARKVTADSSRWWKVAPSRMFSQSTNLAFRASFNQQKRKESEKEEKGLAFQEGELTQEELQDVFGVVVPPARFANRLLRVLNGRRRDGTLDLPPPESMQTLLKQYPYAIDSALRWLRDRYPMDEDAAIMARIEREEASEDYSPAELQQRAQDLGLYGPQSGYYGAKLAEDKADVYGESELDKIRAHNIAEAEKEEEELQEQIRQLQAQVENKKTKALAQRPDQGVEVAKETRPPNSFEKWVLKSRNRAQSKLTLDSPEVARMSLTTRLLPSLIFALLVSAGSYLLAQYWVAPKRSDRMFPNVSLSFATVAAIIAANVVIYGAWGLPSMWRLLNNYFVVTPAYPRAISMLGNLFSHQSFRHLCVNMLALVVFGLSLHEDVGRGTFMGIYLASGTLASVASLANFALRAQLVTSSMGASGSVWGIMAAYCWIHADEKFSFIFVPSEYQDKVQFTGWFFLSVLVIWEIFGALSPLKNIDHVSHIAGIGVGLTAAEWWKRTEEASGLRKERKSKRWYESLPGKGIGS